MNKQDQFDMIPGYIMIAMLLTALIIVACLGK